MKFIEEGTITLTMNKIDYELIKKYFYPELFFPENYKNDYIE